MVNPSTVLDAGDVTSWSFKFQDHDAESEFKKTFARCAYEVSNQIPFSKVKVGLARA